MEKKTLKISFNKNGTGSLTPKLALPKKWTDEMGITIEEREIEVQFDKETKEIKIKKK